MPTADYQTEQTLMQAVTRITDAIQGGQSPTGATVKVAKDLQLSPGAVEIVCRAANIGLTNARREGGLTLHEKTAAFPLADAAAVCRELWPDTRKVAGVPVSSDYDESPAVAIAIYRQQEARKVAGVVPATPTAKSLDLQRQQTPQAAAERLECHRKQARMLRTAAELEFGEAVMTLADYIKSAACTAYDDFRQNALSYYGRPAEILFEMLDEATGDIPRHKRASAGFREFTPYERQLFDAALAAAAVAKQASDLCRKLAVDPPAPRREVAVSALDLSDPETKTASMQLPTSLAWLAGSTATLYNQLGQAADREHQRATREYSLGYTDPKHEQQLEDIRARALLQSLMIDDDVIGGYEPTEVVSAYNDLRSASPQLATNAAAVRPLLRKRLEQGGLADFDLAQIADIQRKLPGPSGLSLNTGLTPTK